MIRKAGGDQKLLPGMLQRKSMGLKGKEAGGRGRAGGDERSKGAQQSPGSPTVGMSRAAHPAHSIPSSPRQAGRHPQSFPVASPGKAAARSQPAQPPAQARQPKYLREALPSLGTATRRRVHMPQQCLIKLPNSKGIPLRLSEDKLGARLLSGNAGTGKEQSSFFFFFLLDPE